MAGAGLSDLAVAVSEAGGLGSIPCAMLTPEGMRKEIGSFRERTQGPLNVNFFCHPEPAPNPAAEQAWRKRLSVYYVELGLDSNATSAAPPRKPFDMAACEVVEELGPEVASFHFGLPSAELLDGGKRTRAKVLSTATTVEEAKWLEGQGCDAIIAQGLEAGGHRGTFLGSEVWAQVGTFALVPQIADAVQVPVIAAGGIGDARGLVAALALGASAVLMGTAYLFCPESTISPLYRQSLANVPDNGTGLTNVFSGRPARGIVNRIVREVGPISDLAPDFPSAAEAIAPLRAASEARGSDDLMQMWAGQAAPLGRPQRAADFTKRVAREALDLMLVPNLD